MVPRCLAVKSWERHRYGAMKTSEEDYSSKYQR